jgi:hypothetical protein
LSYLNPHNLLSNLNVKKPTCGATPRHGVCGDDARVAERAEVEAKAVVVVFAHQLCVHLGHAVDGARSLDGHVRGGVARGVGAKGACSVDQNNVIYRADEDDNDEYDEDNTMMMMMMMTTTTMMIMLMTTMTMMIMKMMTTMMLLSVMTAT